MDILFVPAPSSVAASRPHASHPVPETVAYAPPAAALVASPDSSYHNRDSAGVGTALSHCPPTEQSLAADGEKV